MIENNSNPESGIDRFLAEQVAPATPTVDDLLIKIGQLEQKLSWAEKSRDNYLDTCNRATSYIQASIDRGDWTDEELEEIFWDELSSILDLEMKKTVEVEITARWTATVKMPRGMSFMNMTEHISISEPEGSSYSSVELDDVWERDVNIEEA
jgi:hypothetical protein